MKAALVDGPVSVAINAHEVAFVLYSHGVITSDCSAKVLNHDVLAVGYDTDEETGQEYFLVKNSYGANWGEKGYVKIGVNNLCGILERPGYPKTD